MATHVDDLADMVGSTLGRVAREATQAVSHDGGGSSRLSKLTPGKGGGGSGGPLSGGRGVMAGMAVAAAAPLVGKAAKNAVMKGVGNLKGSATDAVDDVTDSVGGKVKQSVDVPGMAKEAGKKMIPGLGSLPGLGGDSGADEEGSGESQSKKGAPGVGKGRRMPIQQAVDVAVPLEVAYNQWTQFEEWPQFMHRLTQVTQEEDNKVSFKAKMWGMSKEFVADIVEQRPDERIQWNVSQGVTHTGVVTFHELAPRLTRVQVSLDVDPGSLIEKAGRGMRHVKRAARADLARFKAFIEMQEIETGAWRGVIHDGEVVEEHPEDYDSDREYADMEDIHDSEQSHEPQEAAEADEEESSAEAEDADEAEADEEEGSAEAEDADEAEAGDEDEEEAGGRSSAPKTGGRAARHPARPRRARRGGSRPRSRARSGSTSS
jgi:uncharacterized membrane protein